MDVHAADGDDGQVGREGFHVDLVGPLAVERVADRGGDLRRAEMVDALADLLVAGEAHPHRSVAELGMLDEPRGGLHDGGHAGLVVGAQQRRAVAGDERLADERRPARGCRLTRITRLGSPGSTMSPPA